MDKTDISLILSTMSALAVVLGPIAALVVAAFVAGVLFEQHRNSKRSGGG